MPDYKEYDLRIEQFDITMHRKLGLRNVDLF